MKGLPMSYNRDLQEDKEPLFDTVETLSQVLPLLSRLIIQLKFKPERLRAAAADAFITATDLADHLVRQGVPFRQAHLLVGRTVAYCLERGLGLVDLSREELLELCPGADPDILEQLTPENSIKARTSRGGTSPGRVRSAVKKALRELAAVEDRT
ncbi:MAG: argininosuccinate lyase, partial [Pseudomonadota bacterium]